MLPTWSDLSIAAALSLGPLLHGAMVDSDLYKALSLS